MPISTIEKGLEKNIQNIRQRFHHSSDLMIKEIKGCSTEANIIYLDGIVNSIVLQQSVIKPLLESSSNLDFNITLIDKVVNKILETDVKIVGAHEAIHDALVQGSAVLLLEGCTNGIVVEVVEWNERSIERSYQESSANGPVLGFTEKMKTNINILRGVEI